MYLTKDALITDSQHKKMLKRASLPVISDKKAACFCFFIYAALGLDAM